MVLSGANAAIFVAELENPYPTPPRITVSWEEDHQCRFDCPIFGVCGENPC